ncbi:MAG: lactate racemase domain-containing protein [Acidobacteriaceae bacterium]
MSLYVSVGNPGTALSSAQLQELLTSALVQLGERRRVLAVPPDQTRIYSRAGELTRFTHAFYGGRLKAVLPALGTHSAMQPAQITRMFGDLPQSLFRVHNWRTDVETLGEVPGSFIAEQSEGKLNYPFPAQVNRLIASGGFDLVLSIGQVVPHEVIGMANGNKNILIGTGGPESINRSHYLGAVYGMERLMGRAQNPVRAVLNYADEHFLRGVPIVYVLTVINQQPDGSSAPCGLFIGDDSECFERAAELSLQANFDLLDEPLHRAVVYLDPREYKSTWLGNKAIYRTRMALADDAELIILAPGVREFGEDAAIDALIRKYGYRGTEATLQAVKQHPDLAADLSAAAHLIHGSSEGRFRVTYCTGGLTRAEVESVGFGYADLETMLKRYPVQELSDGLHHSGQEEFFFISKPSLGLWAARERFAGNQGDAPRSTAAHHAILAGKNSAKRSS